MLYISCFLQKKGLFLLYIYIGITVFFAGMTSLNAADTWADWRPVYIQTVDISNGNQNLNSNISAIAKDKQGIFWFGTAGSGLIRYDGQHADILRYSSSYNLSLPDNVIHSLAALPDGGLLIGTDVAGVVRFNPMDNNFYPYPATGKQYLGSRIYAIVPDRQGGYWIGSDIGLSHIDSDLKHTRQFFVFCQDNGTCSSQTRAILQEKDGSLLLGTDKGLVRYSPDNQKFTYIHFKTSAQNNIEGIRALYRDSKGYLWIGTASSGVFYITLDGKLHQPESLKQDSPFIRYHSVNSFVETFSGALWIGTRGGGLLSLDRKSGKISFIHQNEAAPENLDTDSIRAFYREENGNIWIAAGDNIAFYNHENDHIFTFNNSGISSKSLADRNVYSILVGRYKQIWLGLGNGQIDYFDKKQGFIRHLRSKGMASGEGVHSLVELGDGSILAASKGLSLINPRNLEVSPYSVPDLPENLIVTNLLYKNNILYIGTPEGLYIYDIKNKKTEHLTHTNSDSNNLANNRILDLAFHDNILAIATAKGLSFYIPKNKKFYNIFHRNDNINTIPNDYIAALRSAGKILWVGIRGGLLKKQGNTLSVVPMPESELFCETIQSLINDTKNRLWIVGSSTIAAINPKTQKIDQINRHSDSDKMIYYRDSAAIGADGEILLGGSNGLTVIPADFHPDIIPQPKAGLAITSVKFNGNELPYGKIPKEGQPLNLPSHAKNLLIRFSLLDYGFSRQIHYSYRLLGQDSEWLNLPAGSVPFVIYSHLPAGHFTFALRATIPGIKQPILETHFPVNVEYRWYEYRFVKIALIIILVLFLYDLISNQIRKLRLMITNKTLELQETNLRLKELANTDELTGLLNRRAFTEMFEKNCAQFSKTKDQFSVFILDIDFFKKINDNEGHLAGDAVIQYIAQKITENIRQQDFAARYGGEEFVIMLPNADMETTCQVASRIGNAISEKPVPYQGREIPVTVSIGVAVMKENDDANSLLERADERLYMAKNQGRNRVSS